MRLNDIVLLIAMTLFWSIVFLILTGPIASLVMLMLDR
jgi:hypothetical protein